jgi:hypothetical protein
MYSVNIACNVCHGQERWFIHPPLLLLFFRCGPYSSYFWVVDNSIPSSKWQNINISSTYQLSHFDHGAYGVHAKHWCV